MPDPPDPPLSIDLLDPGSIGVDPAVGVLVETRDVWDAAHPWVARDDLLPISAARAVGGQSRGEAVLERAFGPVAPPETGTYEQRDPIDLRRVWVRLRLLVPRPRGARPRTIWCGRVESQSMELGGADANGRPTGVQRFVAAGPERILQRIQVASSVWNNLPFRQSVNFRLRRTAPFNYYAPNGHLVGNRYTIEQLPGPHYVFSAYPHGTRGPDRGLWNHAQILDYHLHEFVARYAADGTRRGPRWSLGGPALEFLRQVRTAVEPAAVYSVADIFDELVAPAIGLTWYLEPVMDEEGDGSVDEGFEIVVCPLSEAAVGWAYGGEVYEYPRAERRFALDVTRRADLAIELESSDAQVCDELRVQGERIETAFSFGAQARERAIHPRWSSGLENNYKQPAGTNTEDRDRSRAADIYRDVYQAFGVQPEGTGRFQYDGGAANPEFDDAGDLRDPGSAPNDYQLSTQIRTERALPLQEEEKYNLDQGEINENADQPEFLPPIAIVREPKTGGFVPVDVMGQVRQTLRSASVSPLESWLGLRLRSSPNHVFARNDWAGAAPSGYDPTTDGVDWRELTLTIAARSDHRISLASQAPAQDRADDGSARIVSVPGVRLQSVAPETVVGVAAEPGNPAIIRTPNQLMVVRNDFPRLAREMPGLLARNADPRNLARIEVRGLQTWGAALGAVLDCVNSGGEDLAVGGVVTSVMWDFVRGVTRIGAGHAL